MADPILTDTERHLERQAQIDRAWEAYVEAVVPGLPEKLIKNRLEALTDVPGGYGPTIDKLAIKAEYAIDAWACRLSDEALTTLGADLGLCLSFDAWQAAREARAEAYGSRPPS